MKPNKILSILIMLVVSVTAVPMSSRQSARTVSDEWIGTDEVDRILAETYFSNSRGDNERRKLSKRKSSDQLGQ